MQQLFSFFSGAGTWKTINLYLFFPCNVHEQVKYQVSLVSLSRVMHSTHFQIFCKNRFSSLVIAFILAWFTENIQAMIHWRPRVDAASRKSEVGKFLSSPLGKSDREVYNGIWHGHVEPHRHVIYHWKAQILSFSVSRGTWSCVVSIMVAASLGFIPPEVFP